MGKRETPIQSAVLKYLALKNIWAIRLNVGGARFGNSYVRFGQAGLPDILASHPKTGRIVWIEVKSDCGRLSKEQLNFRKTAIEAGHDYILAKGTTAIDSVINYFRRLDNDSQNRGSL